MSHLQKATAAFEKEENKNFEEFIEKSLKSLREEGVKFEQSKEADSNAQSESQRQEWDEKLAGIEGLFKAFCVLKGQKRKKSCTNNAVCAHVYGKNLLSRTFDAWKRHQQFTEYLHKKYEEAEVNHNRQVLTKALRGWQDVVIAENKTIIKNTTLKKTEMELQKGQREFEQQIKSLEILLQQKLLTLKHEEQQYELLCQKQQILAPTQKLNSD